jgi:hypothetical protein
MERCNKIRSHFSQPPLKNSLKKRMIKYGIFTEPEIPKKIIKLIKTSVCDASSEFSVCNNLSD